MEAAYPQGIRFIVLSSALIEAGLSSGNETKT